MEKTPIREKMSNLNENYQFYIIRPGGNDTALINGIVLNSQKRKEINDLIMQFYPNVEQAGFVELNPVNPQLMMAGGEFCGNATRSTAYLALNGQPGQVEISVFGVKNKLIAGVDQNNNAYAKMPVYPDPTRVDKDNQNRDSWIVEMEGITHYVTFDTREIDGLNPEQIKIIGNKKIKEKKLDNFSAAGVIYVTQTKKTKNGFQIKPVVWVRNIDTLFYESACGSGTTALGLVLAKNNNSGIKVPVVQPSGMTIDIEIDFDGKEFKSAQIKGPIELLGRGSLERNSKGDFVIEQIKNKERLEEAFSRNLVNLYRQIFSQPPYEEEFSENEVKSFFYDYLNQGILFLARDLNSVIGFGAALPLENDSEIAEIARVYNIDPVNTWYMADLGVNEEYRKLGMGTKLVEARLKNFSKGSTVLMRTSENNKDSQNIYRELGFSIVPDMIQKVERQRTDGTIKKDRRIFMKKTI